MHLRWRLLLIVLAGALALAIVLKPVSTDRGTDLTVMSHDIASIRAGLEFYIEENGAVPAYDSRRPPVWFRDWARRERVTIPAQRAWYYYVPSDSVRKKSTELTEGTVILRVGEYEGSTSLYLTGRWAIRVARRSS